MSNDFWKKFDADALYSIRKVDGPAVFIKIEVRDAAEADIIKQRQSIVDVMKSSGLDVLDYVPPADCLHWTPEPEPAFRLFLPKDPTTIIEEIAKDYRARQDRIQERLAKLPVSDAAQFREFPYGWLSIAEVIIEGFEHAFAAHADSKISIVQIKEKFGSLRFYSSLSGSDEFRELISTITNWAEAASVVRCAVTGRPGKVVGPGWLLCLCPEAEYWRAKHADVFGKLVYPG